MFNLVFPFISENIFKNKQHRPLACLPKYFDGSGMNIWLLKDKFLRNKAIQQTNGLQVLIPTKKQRLIGNIIYKKII